MRTALSLTALLPLVAAPEAPTFAVESGTEVTKSFGQVLHLELDAGVVTFNGEEQEQDEIPEVVIDDETEIVFSDMYVMVEDGTAQ